MSESKRERYTARICWNSKNWRFPSGEAAHLETGSYVAKMGFGHEEWLFNFAWIIDGFHYAFLQPVNNSFENTTGKTIDVRLYTISPDRDRLYLGQISDCEVLRRVQADEALKIYEQRGWLESMAEQVVKIDGKVQGILNSNEARHLFNIRFRPEDADIYDSPRIADPKDAVWKRSRYTLAAADEEIDKQWRTRKGSTEPPLVRTITRKGTPGVIYDPIHPRLQADLFSLLSDSFGKGNVTCESDYVDISVVDGKKTTLIEIKTDPTSRAAIREAIGQLLEYAYYRSQPTIGALDLIIIAPGKLDKLSEAYIQRLRTDFNIPISYCSHSEGDPLPGVFKRSQSQVP